MKGKTTNDAAILNFCPAIVQPKSSILLFATTLLIKSETTDKMATNTKTLAYSAAIAIILSILVKEFIIIKPVKPFVK